MLKIICVHNNVTEKAAGILYETGARSDIPEIKLDDLEVIDELIFNSSPELAIEITLGNGKVVDRERAKRIRENGYDLR